MTADRSSHFSQQTFFPPLPVAGRWEHLSSWGPVSSASYFLCTLSLFEVMHWGVRSIGFLLFPYSIASALVARFLSAWLFVRMSVSQVALLAIVMPDSRSAVVAGGYRDP